MRSSLCWLPLVCLVACSPTSKNNSSADAGADAAPAPWYAAPATPDSGGIVGYYRFPTIRGDVVVFTAEGDLWQVDRKGGVASRLTTHLGIEAAAAISLDGATIAFSAAYEGPLEVYTMPRGGGTPVRRTFDGLGSYVVGFAPDGKLIYATGRYSTLPDTQLVRLDLATGEKTIIPLSQAADASWNADGKTLFFTRLPFQGSHTKRYRGGTAQSIWKYVNDAPEAEPLTADFPGTSKCPMWWNGRVYFLSDRDETMNIWSMDENGKDLRQHTQHKGWDIMQASLADGRIVYRQGADLRIFDISTNSDSALDVRIASDFDQLRETWVKKPMDYLTSFDVSPKGDRLALTARGQVFVLPVKQGRIVEVTRKANVRYRGATFLPDGSDLVSLSDESGEVEVWKLPANGVGKTEQWTQDAKVLRWQAIASPNGKWIAHHDKDHRLYVWNIDRQKETLIATSRNDHVQGISWSPDSRWLAYVAVGENNIAQIFIHHVEDEKTVAVTSNRFDSWDPTWSPDGEWLYFQSDRNLKTVVPSPWGARQPDPFIPSPTEIYAVSLKKDGRFPFLPPDELHGDDSKSDGNKKDEGDKKTPPKPNNNDKKEKEPVERVKPLVIDTEGLAERLYKVPIPAGNLSNLKTDGQRLYWLATDPADFDAKPSLQALAIGREKPQVKTVLDNVRDYRISADRKKLVIRRAKDRPKDDEFFVFDVTDKAPDKLDDFRVDLGRWMFSFSPREQWRQMFIDAWRLERDYFYDRGMHGVDWPQMREKYLPLVERVSTREELNDLVAQMVSEISALHTFVVGGDIRRGSDDIDVASLGAEFTRDANAGGYRVAHVYQADPDLPQTLSPLRRNGAGIGEGDVIEAINGVDTLSVVDLGVLLRNQAGRQVLLRVKPIKGESKDVIVVPITSREATNLRYDEWEITRRQKVEKDGKGIIGYVHLRAMGGANFEEWARNFYPVFNRKGLIIDVRHNRGGNIDSWILGKLLRKAWFNWQDRVSDPYWNMQYAFRGHMVVLADESTASDGEAFAEGFKRLGLGKVIGKRTWGGEIWLSGSNSLADNGIATASEFGVYGPEGQWLIEGHGVEPDIVVDNAPHATFGGQDAQLDKALQHLEERLKAEPIKDVPPPAFPNKAPK